MIYVIASNYRQYEYYANHFQWTKNTHRLISEPHQMYGIGYDKTILFIGEWYTVNDKIIDLLKIILEPDQRLGQSFDKILDLGKAMERVNNG